MLRYENTVTPVFIIMAFGPCFLDGRFHEIGQFVQPRLGFRVGCLVLIERVAEDGATDSLELRGDFTGPDRVVGLQRHGGDLRVDLSQLPHRKARKGCAEQNQRAKAGVDPAAYSEIEKRHGPVLAAATRRRNSGASGMNGFRLFHSLSAYEQ